MDQVKCEVALRISQAVDNLFGEPYMVATACMMSAYGIERIETKRISSLETIIVVKNRHFGSRQFVVKVSETQ